MTPTEYRAFVTSMLTYPGALSYERCAIGAATEAAEALEYVAKCRWQGHSFDRDTLALELGDVLFYLTGIDAAIGGVEEDGDEWPESVPNPADLGLGGFYAVRVLFRATVQVEGMPEGAEGDQRLDYAWACLVSAAERFGYSLADLATMNRAKLRARFAASGGEFSAEVSAGRGGE